MFAGDELLSQPEEAERCGQHAVETVQPHPVESPQCKAGLSFLYMLC